MPARRRAARGWAARLWTSCPALLLAWLLAAPDACAQVLQVTLVNTGNLEFGAFVAATGGTINVNISGARTRTGGVILLPSAGVSAATFNIGRNKSGGGNKALIITLPATAQISSGGGSMTVNNFVSNPTNGVVLVTSLALSVGATLFVGPNQVPGNYAGSFAVTVDFQ